MERQKIDPNVKMAAVLVALRGESTIAEIWRKYQINETLFYRWRDKFLEAGKKSLTDRNGTRVEAAAKARISELERIIGKRAVQNEILKKFRSRSGGCLSGLVSVGLRLSGYWDMCGFGMALGPPFIDGSRRGRGPAPQP